MHAPSGFSKNLLTCSAASSCSTAFFRAFYLRGCESLPLGTEGQTSIFGELTSEEQQIAIFHLLPRNVNPSISLPLHNRYKWRWRWDITLSLINNTLDTFMLAQELRPLVLQLLQHPPESNNRYKTCSDADTQNTKQCH